MNFWSDEIIKWSRETGLEVNLIATVMQIESCGNPHAVSPSGALGLFQVMPYHFLDGEDPFDPETNALRGLSYLARSLELAEDDLQRTLAGYNGGHGVIDKDPSTWSDETVRYVYWGTGIYQEALMQEEESKRLNEWLNAGGTSLCQKAREVQMNE